MSTTRDGLRMSKEQVSNVRGVRVDNQDFIQQTQKRYDNNRTNDRSGNKGPRDQLASEWNEDRDLWMTDHIGDFNHKREQYEQRLRLQQQQMLQKDKETKYKGSGRKRPGDSHHFNVITGSWSETGRSRS